MKHKLFLTALIALLAFSSAAFAETKTYTLVPPEGSTNMDYTPGAYNSVGTLKITAPDTFSASNKVSVVVKYDGKFTHTSNPAQTVDYTLVNGTADSYTALNSGDMFTFTASQIDAGTGITLGAVIAGEVSDTDPYDDTTIDDGDYRSNIAFNAYLEPIFSDTYTFGTYDGQALTWKVIGIDRPNKRFLLLTSNDIGRMAFGETTSWKDSTIRAWLNDDFLSAAFTEEERNRIAEVTLQTEDYSVDSSTGVITTSYTSTLDRIFLLSRTEIETYMNDASSRALSYLPALVGNYLPYYWLRTYVYDVSKISGVWTATTPNAMQIVICRSGGIEKGGTLGHGGVEKKHYVRPALWLKYGN